MLQRVAVLHHSVSHEQLWEGKLRVAACCSVLQYVAVLDHGGSHEQLWEGTLRNGRFAPDLWAPGVT